MSPLNLLFSNYFLKSTSSCFVWRRLSLSSLFSVFFSFFVSLKFFRFLLSSLYQQQKLFCKTPWILTEAGCIIFLNCITIIYQTVLKVFFCCLYWCWCCYCAMWSGAFYWSPVWTFSSYLFANLKYSVKYPLLIIAV